MGDENRPGDGALAILAAITEQIASGVSADEIKEIVKSERLEPSKVHAYVQGVIRSMHPNIEALWREFGMDEKIEALKEGRSKPLWDPSIRPEAIKAKYLKKKREILLEKLKEIEPEHREIKDGLEAQAGEMLAQMRAVKEHHLDSNGSLNSAR